jgi:cell division protein ZapE
MGMDTYYHPTGKASTKQAIKEIWDQLTNSSPGTPSIVQVAQGRTLMIDRQAKNVAEVEFSDMCETPKGSTDYMALAKNFHTIIIRSVP